METLKRHPAEESFGVQNAHMLNGLAAIQHCVSCLIRKGFTVLAVRIGHREPTVLVQHEARCEQLQGAASGVAIGSHGREQIMAAPFEGCSVQWVVSH